MPACTVPLPCDTKRFSRAHPAPSLTGRFTSRLDLRRRVLDCGFQSGRRRREMRREKVQGGEEEVVDEKRTADTVGWSGEEVSRAPMLIHTTLLYPTLPYPTLPYTTLTYHTLSYPTLLCLLRPTTPPSSPPPPFPSSSFLLPSFPVLLPSLLYLLYALRVSSPFVSIPESVYLPSFYLQFPYPYSPHYTGHHSNVSYRHCFI